MARLLLTLAALAVFASAVPGVEPSANKARRGTYQAKTSKEGYNYFVSVPECYRDDNPAGICLFFHGQGNQGVAESMFQYWKAPLLDGQNLIGVNMQYMDGDNSKDTEGKVAAAVEALAQVEADYKIIRGRGVISSFSGGGLPHTLMMEKYGRADAKPGTWWFNHSAGYDSNLHVPVRNLATMSWFFALGSEEWNMARLGPDLTARAQDIFADAAGIPFAPDPRAKGGKHGHAPVDPARLVIAPNRSPDGYLKITKGKGHEMTAADMVESARVFRRSDVAETPFLYEPDFAGTDLDAVVKKANRLEYGGASADLKKLLANPKTKPETATMADAVDRRIEKRVDEALALARELAENDAALWNYYSKLFAKQLAGHPRLADFKKIKPASPPAEKGKKLDAEWALATLGHGLSGLFAGGPTLAPGAEDVITKVLSAAGEKSSIGRMCAEFLLLKPAAAP